MNATDFLELQEVKVLHEKAQQHKHKDFSQVKDRFGNQYVNLVQEGGGVLGIALVGFTYILESVGIRFWRLAGTSAGAINAMMLAAIGEKSEKKSERILEMLAKKDLLDFVDGHEDVPRILRRLSIDSNYLEKITKIIMGAVGILFINLLLLSIHHNPWLSKFVIILFFLLLTLGLYLWYLWTRLRKARWGICKGVKFHDWIKDNLSEQGIQNMEHLRRRAYKSYGDMDLKMPSSAHFIESDLTLITCDITRGLKVQFPKDMVAYGLDEKTTNPADFVRASMSIPLFYEAFAFQSSIIPAFRMKIAKEDKSLTKSYFVDGGVVSNFPINTFHNPKIREPRLPVVGVRLGDGAEAVEKNIFKSIVSYIYRIFNTIRYHSDKEFLRQYEFYQDNCVHEINLQGFNWLNFAMSDSEKQQLFVKGVEAGLKFIEEFDWTVYTGEREKLYDSINLIRTSV